MMRILYLSTHLPIPANNGQAMRTQSLVRALVGEGHEVVFVSYHSPNSPTDLKPLSDWCKQVEGVPRKFVNMSQGRDVVGRLRAIFTFRSYAIERFRSSSMRARVSHLLEKSFDLVFVDSIYALVNLPETRIPIALNCHNLEWLILERYASLESNPLKRWYAKFEARRIRSVEHKAYAQSSLIVVCSELECERIIGSHPTSSVMIVPNSVDCDLYSLVSTNRALELSPTLLFQGGMDWYPNREAVEFFINQVLAKVQEQIPNISFVVAGRNPPLELVNKFSRFKRVRFTGTVPDMRPYLNEATLIVVPLRIGGGTRIKILEAGASGKAMVSTRVGAEGLNLRDGIEIALADTPEDFAKAVVGLLRDAERRDAMGNHARQRVQALYAFSNVQRAVGQMMLTLQQKTIQPTMK